MADNKKYSLRDQINALELETANLRGHVSNIRDLARQGKYNPDIIHQSADRVPILEAAIKSLQFLEKNQEKIKSLFSKDAK